MNQIISVLSGIILLLIGLIVYLLISRRKLWVNFHKAEYQLLLSQINPHFIFNSLTAIQSFLFRNDSLQASKYLSIFAKLIRLILENSRLEAITIEREKRTLELYLDLQTLRFEGKFDYKIEIDESIDIDEQTIPPLLAQPFIENFIEHGFIQLSEKGIISIRFKKSKESIVIEVEDYGINFDKSKFNQLQSGKDYLTRATEIAYQRLKKIWQTRKLKIEMEVIDLNSIDISKQGSLVRFIIPIKN